MRKPILPDPQWGSEVEVTAAYHATCDARLKTRLNVIRLLWAGVAVRDVARAVGVCTATVRNWRTRWNRAGKEGLRDGYRGSKSTITPAIRAEIQEVVEVTRVIQGQTVTGKLLVGYLKKNTT